MGAKIDALSISGMVQSLSKELLSQQRLDDDKDVSTALMELNLVEGKRDKCLARMRELHDKLKEEEEESAEGLVKGKKAEVTFSSSSTFHEIRAEEINLKVHDRAVQKAKAAIKEAREQARAKLNEKFDAAQREVLRAAAARGEFTREAFDLETALEAKRRDLLGQREKQIPDLSFKPMRRRTPVLDSLWDSWRDFIRTHFADL